MQNKFLFLFLFTLLAPFVLQAQFYHGSQQQYGKNRLQFDEFFWKYYRMEKFDVYYYEKGRDIAQQTAIIATSTLEELEKMFDYKLETKLYFLVYSKYEHFKQSNIGIEDDAENNIGGVTRIAGNKMFIYNEGDIEKLKLQIKTGLAQIIVNQMMFGENWREQLKNSTLLSLPDWYLNGLVSYSVQTWSVGIDNQVRDAITNGRYNKFNKLMGKEAEVAGHALWNYIAKAYGENLIPNILYMARVSRNVESGFLFVLGVPMSILMEQSALFYRSNYMAEGKSRLSADGEDIPIYRYRKTRNYRQLKLSADGSKLAYVTNEKGQYKIWIKDLNTGKTTKILKEEPKLEHVQDETYPIVLWHPKENILSVIREQKGKTVLTIFQLDEDIEPATKEIFKLEKILSATYSPDGKHILFSAIQNSKTDLFLYSPAGNSQEQLTNDVYDDLYPAFMADGKSIIFSSNRDEDTLRTEKYQEAKFAKSLDLYLYDLANKSSVLQRVSNTPEYRETMPFGLKNKHFTFLSDENGMISRYEGFVDSAIAFIDTTIHYRYFTNYNLATNYNRNIIEQDFNANSNTFTQLIFENGKFHFKKQLVDSIAMLDYVVEPTSYYQSLEKIKQEMLRQEKMAAKKEARKSVYTTVKVFDSKAKDPEKIDINNYTFENEVVKPADPPSNSRFVEIKSQAKTDSLKKDLTIHFPGERDYHVSFTATDLVSQVDFDYANQIYQNFNGGPYINSGIGTTLKVGMYDIFEDYKTEGGVRFSFGNTISEYFISFENRSKRLDKRYLFQRQSLTSNSGNVKTKTLSNQAKYILKYPLSDVSAIRGSFGYRNDHEILTAPDSFELKKPDTYYHRLNAKLEYIYDTSLPLGMNLQTGTKVKVFAEAFNTLFEQRSFISILGIDARHYQKINRNFIWAGRFAASTSLGQQKVAYYLGGVDNWIVLNNGNRFDSNVPISQDQNYVFQSNATSMRGFKQNIRNGNSFFVLTSEFRMPLFKYLSNRPLKSEFLTNFQVIWFNDLGTAWTGKSPFDSANNYEKPITDGSITVRVQNDIYPIVGNYGYGFRSKILGYYIRIDRAFGIEDGLVLKPMTHISLGLDF